MKRKPPVAIGNRRVREQVAQHLRSHPVFRVPTDMPKKLALLLKRLGSNFKLTHNGEFLAGGPAIGAGIFAGALASGTSGDVVVTWTGQSANAAGLILLSVAKISTTAFDFASQVFGGGGGTSASDTIDLPSNGVLIVASSHTNTNDTTLSGVTERSAINVGSGRFEVGFDNRMNGQTNRAISASWSGSSARGFQARSFQQI